MLLFIPCVQFSQQSLVQLQVVVTMHLHDPSFDTQHLHLQEDSICKPTTQKEIIKNYTYYKVELTNKCHTKKNKKTETYVAKRCPWYSSFTYFLFLRSSFVYKFEALVTKQFELLGALLILYTKWNELKTVCNNASGTYVSS